MSFNCYFKLLFIFTCILMLIVFILFENYDNHKFHLLSRSHKKITKKYDFTGFMPNSRQKTTTATYRKNVRLNLLHSSKLQEKNSNLTSSKDMEKVFEDRATYLRQMCDKLQFDKVPNIVFGNVNKTFCVPRRKNYGYSECIFTENYHLSRISSSMICSIHKVASTTIISSILRASNLESDNESPHITGMILNAKTMEEFHFAKKYFFKFLIVRHPMRRLLSAYMNKVELLTEEDLSLFKMRENLMLFLVRYSKELSRENEINKENGTSEITSVLFKKVGNFEMPTFEGFLLFIMAFDIQGQGFDSHWVPYWKRCAPCSFNYDVILKLDSNYSELEYIWPALGFAAKDLPWVHKSTKEDESEERLLKKHYSSLSLNVIMRVYHTFLFDFKLFDYSICDVLLLGGHCSDSDCCHKIIYNYFPY